jgi:PAS domain S-box-containing protein
MHDPKLPWVRARVTLISGVQGAHTALSLEVSEWRALLVSLRTQAGWRKAVGAVLPLFAYAVAWIISLHVTTVLALVLNPRIEGPDPLFVRGAVTVSALLLTRPRRWWLVLLLTLPLVPLDCWFLGLPNTATVREVAFFAYVIIVCISVVTVSLIRRYLALPLRFASVGEVSRFMACVAVGAVPPILIAAFARAIVFSWDIWLSWQIGYLGYVLGIVVFTPAIVLWLTEGPRGLGLTSRREQVEGGLLLLTAVVASVVVFGTQLPDRLLADALLFALVPTLIWAAVRFGPQGLASMLALVTIVAITGAVNNRGPFVGGSATDGTLALQLYLLFVGVPLFFLAAVVQERKQAGVELQASEERYRGVVESQTELISRYLPDTTLTFVNEANCRSMGLSREQLLGTKFIDLLPESEREPVRAMIRSVLAHPGVLTLEHQTRMADGSLRWQQWVNRTIRDDMGRVIEIQGVGRDITERKQMVQQLYESEARYRATFDSAAIGVAITDLAGRPLEVNEYVCRMVGYTEDELRAMALRDFTHPDDVADNEALLRRALDGELGSYQLEKRYLHKDGHVVWSRLSASLVHSQDGKPTYFVVHLEDITPRKQLEHERAEQAKQLEAVMEAVPEPLTVYDTDGRVMMANTAYHTLVARLLPQAHPGETVRQRVQQLGGFYAPDGTLLEEDEWAQTRALRGEVLAGSDAVEIKFHSPEGELLSFSMTAAPLRDSGGHITGAVVMSRDITAYKRLEREHEEARAQAERRAEELDRVFEAMTDGVAVYDQAGQMVRANAALHRLLGLDTAPPAFAKLSLPERFALFATRDAHGQPLAPHEGPMLRALADDVLAEAEALDGYLRTLDGREVELRVSAAPIRSPAGQVVGTVLVYRDVTERNQLLRERAEQAEQLNRIFEGIADGLVVYDADGHVVRANTTARRILGLDAAPADYAQVSTHGRAVLYEAYDEDGRRLPPEEWPLLRVLKGLVADADARDVRLRVLDGREVEVHTSAAPLRDETGRLVGAVSILHDQTERRRLERERAEAQANEVAAQEVAQHMDAFIAAASHDIRTPTTVVSIFVELALRRAKQLAEDLTASAPTTPVSSETIEHAVGTVEAVIDKLGDARAGVDQLQRLVEVLFDVARARSGMLKVELAPCDLADLVRTNVAMQQAVVSERRIDLEGCEKIVPVVADADRLGQVLGNYLTNALKYSPVDQPVTVKLDVLGDQAVVSVVDHGPGLPVEEQRRIWELFHRVPGVEVQPGSSFLDGSLGLGLYTCKQLIELHPGGRVGVESVLGEGSTFWFQLPLASSS